jgi:hypothetical protein
MHGREVHALFWWENLKERDCLKDLETDEITILKCVLWE